MNSARSSLPPWLDDLEFDREWETLQEALLEAEAEKRDNRLRYRDYAMSCGKEGLPSWILMRIKVRDMMLRFGQSEEEIEAIISQIIDPKIRLRMTSAKSSWPGCPGRDPRRCPAPSRRYGWDQAL